MAIINRRIVRVLGVMVPALLVGAIALPRALAWGHHRYGPPSSAGELSERMRDKLEYVLDEVDASDAQRARADALAQERGARVFTLMSEGRGLRQQLKQALLADQLDRARVDALRGQLDGLVQRVTAEGLDGFYALAEILTPAQRTKVADKLARFDHGDH